MALSLKVTYKVLYNRRNKKTSKDGRHPIEIKAYLTGENPKWIKTNIRIFPEEWNAGKSVDIWVNRKHANYQNLNNHIRAMLKYCENLEREYLDNHQPFHLHYLALPTKQAKQDQQLSFTKFWDDFVKSQPLTGTVKDLRTTLKRFKKFRSDTLFSQLNKKLILDYELFLLDDTYTKQGKQHKLKPGFIHNNLKCLQTMVNKAIGQELLQPNPHPFTDFKFSHYFNYDRKTEFLLPHELRAIEDLQFTHDNRHLIRVRDMFLLACYTGMRFGDVTNLSRDQIKETGSGVYVDLMQQKTKRQHAIPLNHFERKPLHIIMAYMASGRKFLFEYPANQYINRQLKEIAVLAGINKRIHFHMARHTCATILLSEGKPMAAVCNLLGHSSIAMTERYAKLIPNRLEEMLTRNY